MRRDGSQEGEHPHGPQDGDRPRGFHHGEDMPMERQHREPVTFLGVGVEPVPPVLLDQLNLPEGFGLVATYVVPGSPAEKAGIKANDILKSLNDQQLVAPDQLSTLVRSFAEGQEVSLTVLRKGQDTKVSVKLEKQVPPPMMDERGGPGERRPRRMPFNFNGRRERDNNEDDDMDFYNDEAGPGPDHARRDHAGSPPPPPAPPVREILRELRPEVRDAMRAARAGHPEEFQEAERKLRKEITILRERDGASRTTRLDLGQARIVVRDAAGELVLKVDDGKRLLVAKDTEGKLLFSGPVNTDEERKALPSDVRARLEKLEHEQMPEPPASPKPAEEPKAD